MTGLDPRLHDAHLPLDLLADIFVTHFRGVPAAMTCPGCGHRFAEDDTEYDCPTNTVVRALLYLRWRHNYALLAELMPAKAFDNLRWVKPQPRRAKASAPVPVPGDLFDITPYRRHHRKDGQ